MRLRTDESLISKRAKSFLAIAIMTLATTFAGASWLAPFAFAAEPLASSTFAKAKLATFILDNKVSYCTVEAITPDGYALTALHCLRDCLVQSGQAETASNAYIGLQDLLVVKNPQSPGAVCDQAIAALGTRNVSVIATGTGLSSYDSSLMFTFNGLANELKSIGLESRATDFALIKIPVTKPVACVPLSAQKLSHAQSITAIGYPMPLDPKTAPSLTLAQGSVYGSAAESRYYQARDSAREKAWADRLYSADGVIYSNANTALGFSGGPIVAADGSLVGVISGFTSVQLANSSELHELVGTSVAQILEKLPQPLAASLLQKSAGCK